ncbi:hypothetical protein TEA_008707 [Camellia sinensis var. sinensis]|uniref:Aspartate/glutamate/uridylate kinase domain-containing protein n=1 Tax=Camellia sinensis var. sinensis TaxID=542762 RepID=A0A4S4E233_CAMSN|nr:hypothetical protein TEA_008707 [Camellia sinensis var. sinensis]
MLLSSVVMDLGEQRPRTRYVARSYEVEVMPPGCPVPANVVWRRDSTRLVVNPNDDILPLTKTTQAGRHVFLARSLAFHRTTTEKENRSTQGITTTLPYPTYLDHSTTTSSSAFDTSPPCSVHRSVCRAVETSCTRRVLRVNCEGTTVHVLERNKIQNQNCDGVFHELTCVMKFGGSSVASSDRMREVADLILSFPEERPVIVLSAMGKTTTKLLLAGEKAVTCGVSNVSDVDEFNFVKELHLRTMDELGIDRSTISTHLEELEQLLKGIAQVKELTLRTRDYLVSFGECMSTRIFASYLSKIGVKARQYDAFDIGFITTDDFTNADILEATYPAVAKRLHSDWISDPAIPIVTGFLGKGWRSCAVTTLGRGGSDLTATTIGKALGLREIQVWKDVDGVLTCDPNIYARAEPVPYLTFEEAAELAYFGAQDLLTVLFWITKMAGQLSLSTNLAGRLPGMAGNAAVYPLGPVLPFEGEFRAFPCNGRVKGHHLPPFRMRSGA